MKKNVIFLFFLLVITYSYAQNALTLNNYNRFKRIVYAPGDGIYLQTKDKLHFSGQIDAVNDSFLTISKIIEVPDDAGVKKVRQQDYVPLKEIRAIYLHHIPKKWGASKTAAGTFFLAGLMFSVLGGWGYKFYKGATSSVKANFGLAAGSFVASGLVKLASPNKHLVGERWQLKVSPLYNSDLQTLSQ